VVDGVVDCMPDGGGGMMGDSDGFVGKKIFKRKEEVSNEDMKN
jgi:hypothetical protein